MSEQLDKIFEELQKRFKRDVFDKKVVYYFSLGNTEDDKYTVYVDNEKCTVKKGKHTDNADCVVKTSVEMFIRIVKEGYEPDLSDGLFGRFKTNDPSLLLKFKRAVMD